MKGSHMLQLLKLSAILGRMVSFRIYPLHPTVHFSIYSSLINLCYTCCIAVPLEAPQNFSQIKLVDARSRVFRWDPVSPDSLRGHFRGYKVGSKLFSIFFSKQLNSF